MSVHDPEMRHGHKSSSRRFDGHKAAIVVDTDTQLITAVEVLPGNAPDNLGALELVEQSEANTGVPVEEAMGDAAYGDGATRQTFADAGRTAGSPGAGPARPEALSQGMTLSSTWPRAVAPVRRDRSPTPSCQRESGRIARGVAPTACRPSSSTGRYVGYVHCGPSASRPRQEGTAGADPSPGSPPAAGPGVAAERRLRRISSATRGGGAQIGPTGPVGNSPVPLLRHGPRRDSSCIWRLQWPT